MSNGPILDSLCEFADELTYDDLDRETVDAAKRRIFDSLATAVTSLEDRKIRELVTYAASKHGADDGAIVGTERTAAIEYASLANGAMIRHYDWNDTYLSAEAAHPSGNVGAVLAAADSEGLSGREVVLATVLAYEVQCELCDRASFTDNGFDHVNYGLVSVPLAVGKLLGLTEAELKESVKIALCGHLGLLQARRAPVTEWKGYAFGNAARNGVVAVELARNGVRGASNVFDGEQGINTVVDPAISADELDLGGDYAINRTHLKKYPICHHALGAVDCAFDVVDATGLDWEDVEAIDVRTYEVAVRAAAGSEKWRPTTRGTADHSIPYCVARALIDGKLGPDELREDRLGEADVVALMDRIDVHHDEAYTESYGDAFPHHVTITTANAEYEREVNYPLGHYENPLSTEEIVDKVARHAGCSTESVDELRARVDDLDGLDDLAPLLDSASAVGEGVMAAADR